MTMPEQLRAVADAAKGFLPDDEAQALYDAALAMAAHGPLLEVGTYCGKSATYLGPRRSRAAGTVVTVDHHRGSEENQPGWEWHDAELVDPAAGAMDTLPFFRRTMHAAGLEDVVVAVVGGRRRSPRWWRTPLALLFIDGGHAEEHCIADYGGWSPHVAARRRCSRSTTSSPTRPTAGRRRTSTSTCRRSTRTASSRSRHAGSLRVLRRARRLTSQPQARSGAGPAPAAARRRGRSVARRRCREQRVGGEHDGGGGPGGVLVRPVDVRRGTA